MSTVVQRSYRPQIAYGVEGMISDETPSVVGSRNCETAAGIGFGKAVSVGTNARGKGCVLGGSSFIGLSVRDVTLGLAPVDPLSDTPNTLDKYGVNTAVAVMSAGHMWVKPQGNVADGDAVYYDATTGQLGNSASGLAASGFISFTKNPDANETIVVNGVTITFKASGATGDDINIGATLGDTVALLAATLEASSTGGLAACHFRAEPPTPVGGGSGANTLLIDYATVGTAGNSAALDASGTDGATASASTLLGGTASATAITGAKWIDSAIAGQLARVSLGIQY